MPDVTSFEPGPERPSRRRGYYPPLTCPACEAPVLLDPARRPNDVEMTCPACGASVSVEDDWPIPSWIDAAPSRGLPSVGMTGGKLGP